MAVIDELLVSLGYDYDDSGTKQFTKDLKKTVSVVKAFAVATVAGFTALTTFTAVSTAATDEQVKFARQIGMSVGELEAISFAATRTGVSVNSITRGMQDLAIRASEASRGMGQGAVAFGMLGINVNDANGTLKSTGTLLQEVSGAIQGMEKGRQLDMLNRLGLKDSALLLQEGSAGIAALTREARMLGVATEEDARVAEEFQDSLTDLAQITRHLSRLFVRVIGPALKEMNARMTEWWKTNRKFIELNLPIYIERLVLGLKMLTAVAALWIGVKMIQHGMLLIAMFRKLSVASVMASAGPVALAISLAAIVLAIQDLIAFKKGDISVFGEMINEFPELERSLDYITDALKFMGYLITKSIDGWKMLADLIGGIEMPAWMKSITGRFGFGDSVETGGSASAGGAGGAGAGGVTTNTSSPIVIGTMNFKIDGVANGKELIQQAMDEVNKQARQEFVTMVVQ